MLLSNVCMTNIKEYVNMLLSNVCMTNIKEYVIK